LPQELFDARKAICLALDHLRQQTVETSWSDSGQIDPAEWSIAGDPNWSGGSICTDTRRIIVQAEAENVWKSLSSIGGETGYYHADWLWKLRGLIDRLFGGVGLDRGRRSTSELYPGDAIDFWRVTAVEKPKRLCLVAEMKLPGKAVLAFDLKPLADGHIELRQSARFLPRGLMGLLYWYAVLPFHHYVFNGMLRGIATTADLTILRGPERLKPDQEFNGESR
jgi:hypothetical protein